MRRLDLGIGMRFSVFLNDWVIGIEFSTMIQRSYRELESQVRRPRYEGTERQLFYLGYRDQLLLGLLL